VCGDHPVLSDDTLERDEVSVLVVAGRVRRDVDVAAVVVEDGSPRGGRQMVTGRLVEVERASDFVRLLTFAPVDVDPEEDQL